MNNPNIHNLDPWLYDILKDSIQPPNADKMRVTQLIDSPLVRNLTIKHWDNLEVDISEFLNTTYGDAIHDYFARKGSWKGDKEQEVSAVIEGTNITGHFDVLTDGVLRDYKTTGVGYLRIGDNVEKWTQQLNIYAYLIGTYGVKVNKLEINVLYRNWTKMKLGTKDYPEIPYEKLKLPLWSTEMQLSFIKERLDYHHMNPTSCSDKERWKKDDIWGVWSTEAAFKKKGGRTLKNFSSEEAANKWSRVGDRYIEHRVGTYLKCDKYCFCKQVCPMYKGN